MTPNYTSLKFYKKRVLRTLNLLAILMLISGLQHRISAQNCTGGVPTYSIDFRGNPNGTWISPQLIRSGNCCGTVSPDRCLNFEIVLDSNTAAVNFSIASGAIPPGALFYQINCGQQTQVGQYVCVSGSGTQYLTFCKPGNNTNTYAVTSIPKPIFPKDDTIRVGCTKTLRTLGLVPSTVTFQSIFPGAPGQYDSYLSCTSGCDSSLVTPDAGAPAYVDYIITGYPIADQCGFNVTVSDTIRVFTPSALIASASPNPGSFCPGSSGITLTGNASGGAGPYTYSWSRNGTTLGNNLSQLANSAGSYVLTVQDRLSACPVSSITIPVNQTNVTLSSSITDVSCRSGNNGSITITPSGGSTPYSYSWSPNVGSGATVSNLVAGTYTVTVTDAGGCSQTTSATVSQPTAIATSTASITNVGCKNESTGATVINVSGGTGPYTYLWSNGDFTRDLSNVPANTYTLTVTDANGCTRTHSVTITEPAAIVPLVTGPLFSSTNISCKGLSDGTATAAVSGGTPPYSYAWSNGGNTPTLTGLPAGSLTVTVTDNNGCKTSSSITLTEPDSLLTSVVSVSQYNGLYNVSCNGFTDGSVDIDVTGGTPGYSYSWSNSAVTQDLNAISAGAYTVTVTDANGCTQQLAVTLAEPAPLSLGVTSPLSPNGTNIACKGESSGRIYSSVTGGVPPFSYSWSTGTTSQDLLWVPAGFYTLIIADDNGCLTQDTITLTEPDTLYPRITAVTVVGNFNVSCANGNDGNATVIVSGGSAPYTYLWNTGDTTVTIDSLAAGDIYVTVYDINHCSAADTATLIEPTPLQSITAIVASVTCAGSSDGQGFVDVQGGTAPYSYSWTNGDATSTPSGLNAGWHYVTITDANNCIQLDSLEMTQPDSLLLQLDPSIFADFNNISCNGGNNGSIDLTVIGGTGNYYYTWSNGSTDEDITDLVAGTYDVTVVDDNGCITSAGNITLTEPGPLVVDNISSPTYPGGWNVSCNGGDNGAVNVVASGGAGNYTYYWSNGDTTQNISNVSVFVYYVTVTDQNGCTAQDSLWLTEPTLLTAQISTQNNVSCFGGSDASLTINASGSTPGYTYSIDGANFQSNPDFPGLSANTYNITVSDTNLCAVIVGATVTQPSTVVSVASVSTTNASCFGANNGSAVVHAAGGTPPYEFSSDNINFVSDSTFTSLSATTYTVYIRDANFCGTSTSFTINQPTVLATTVNSTSTTCGLSNGVASISVSGGTGPYTYNWSNGGTTDTISGLPTNNYSCIVTDANGCTISDNVTVGAIASLLVSNGAQVDNTCFGASAGSATVAVQGGTSPYSYSWSNGQTGATISGLTANSYTVTVSDVNSCTASFTFNITEPSLVVASSTAPAISCPGNTTVITVAGAGGVGPYTGTGDFTVNEGTYTYTIADANGCQATTSIVVAVPAPFSTNAGVDQGGCAVEFILDADLLPGQSGIWSVLTGSGTFADANRANSTVRDLADGNNVYLWTVIQGVCTATDTVMIAYKSDAECELELPTGYSPNGDGFNDGYSVKGLDRYPENTLVVFNRWGNEVYKKDNYKNNDWIGQNTNGEELPEGTYFVILEIKNSNIRKNSYIDLRRGK